MPGIPSKPNNIPLASSLPKVSFRKIPPDEALFLHIPPGIIDPHALPFGYNDSSQFDKPDHYIRYVEPIEGDLKKQVEYDMDEQDQEWLDALNYDRRKEGLDTISYETFEIILDQLEKEWFDLMRRVPPKARHSAGAEAAADDDDDRDSEGGEDSKCAICDDGECENSNAIVFCDGCNLAVHQDCYGIPYIPEGQWLCRKCTVSPDRAVSCILCPHEGGAFKQTTTGKWAHLLCAMWIPETGVSNPVYMEPIDSVERIPKARWKLQCYLCKYRMGACIQCDNRSCFTAFHVTCARKAGLLFRTERTRVSHHLFDESDGSDDESAEMLRACCHRHMPADMRDQFKIDFGRQAVLDEERSEMTYHSSPFVSARTRELSVESGHGAPLISVSRRSSIVGSNDCMAAALDNRNKSKSARAYKKSFKAGPPLVPAYIANRVLEYITKIHLRKKSTAVQLIARYWSLKREARRGAPLLKRLHLEPWTASSQNKEQTDAQKGKKLHFLRSIRADLERVRMLVEQVRKREKEKLRQAQEIRSSLVEPVLFPYHADLRAAIARFEAVDKYGFFAHPVSKVDVPDYYDIVKRPMDWATIKDNIANTAYESVQAMREDVIQIATNAMTYNKPDTPYHKAAMKIVNMIPDIFKELVAIETSHWTAQQQRWEQQRQKDVPQQKNADTEAPAQSSANGLDAETKRELLELGLEPPCELVALLRDYDLLTEENQSDLRKQAYGDHPMPPTMHVKAEEEGREDEAGHLSSPLQRQDTPVMNLMEDFVHQIYVPQPTPQPALASPHSKQPSSRKEAAAVSTQKAPKLSRKRKVSDVTPREPPARRSARRTIAVEPHTEAETQTTTSEAPAATPTRSKRLRAQSSVNASTVTSGAGAPDDVKAESTPMSKSVSQPAVKTHDGVQVKEDVGAHASFLLFNTGWVLPEGSKRHRNAAARPEMIGQRPRKISAPESPAPAGSTAAVEQAVQMTPQRPRSCTVPSSSQRARDSAAPVKEKEQGIARRRLRSKKQKEEGQEANTAGSSPLTSDDEGDKDGEAEAKAESEQKEASERRSKRNRERETSHVSEASSDLTVEDTPAASTRRSVRKRTTSIDPSSTSLPASKRPHASPKPSYEAHYSTPPATGTKVWAKIDKFPHHPAIAVTDESRIPKDIVKNQPKTEGMVAVAFYGKPKTWGWVSLNKLAPLLVDDAEDERYLKLAAKKGKTREVRVAFEEAKFG
ncbi:related to Peregrin (Bromodomain and PHD finger-containing protein 1) [Melanopsichium pennsylvanicum]|uniref:Related to Peregrin (Bromodomain and PHD finger-containing protein 1) n=2 Tax=Melanopsichium pennsylvanicum TaxID=63383 RepID=A0AAJ4XSK9_9BASI|nr:related to Peregrin (Bromodomain and PHD finger-containing protein 1) [Melanopsichium pennsylvanicum 4]SNX87844.1 related to Peregrin (Bromodomain and PHD finger-containing protein 1) [Melanopsichium pennsylvanicum]